MLRSQVLNSYASLLRTQRKVFQNDPRALQIAKVRTRQEFIKNKDLNSNGDIQKAISDAREAASFLKHNILQAEQTDKETLKIRATQDTELIRWDYEVPNPPPVRERTKRAQDMKPVAGPRSSAAQTPAAQAGCGTGCGCGAK